MTAEFLELWPTGNQTPSLHATAAQAGRVFLGGGYPPPVARIRPGTVVGSTARIDRGTLHGVDVGTVFRFHATDEAALRRDEPVASATVEEVELAESVVRFELPSGGRPDARWCGLADSMSMATLRVHLAAGLAAPVVACIARLEAGGVLVQVSASETYDLSLRGLEGGAVALESAAPTSVNGADPGSTLLRVLDADVATPEALSDELEYLARIRRLLTLSRAEGSIEVKLVGDGAAFSGPVPEIEVGQSFAIEIHNRSRYPLHLNVIALTPELGAHPGASAISMLAPLPGEELIVVRPGGSAAIDGLVATASLARERTTIKVIASQSAVDLYPLVAPPSSRTRGGGQPRTDDPFEALVAAAANGSTTTRGVVLRSSRSFWTTSAVTFDVVRGGR